MINVLSETTLKQHNEKRCKETNVNTSSPCNAPFNNMYFTTLGTVAPCWLLVGQVDNWSQSRSIKDIWFGENFTKIRNDLLKKTFNGQCVVCKENIDKGVWPLAMAYDQFSLKEYPTLMELELSNQCNLECIMCEGRLSSGIRKNRDKLGPLPMIYDNSFVEQLEEFIPHLEELRFNGGEPFAQKIVHDICHRVARIHPDLKINIATNGTVYNKAVQNLMDTCNIHLNISIDSLQKDMYESIRINGDFDSLMKNFEIFKKYCLDNDRILSVMFNPMRMNWHEITDFFEWTSKHGVHLWYNTIHHPKELSIWNLPTDELQNIYNTLKNDVDRLRIVNTNSLVSHGNYEKFNHYVNGQIKNWLSRSKMV